MAGIAAWLRMVLAVSPWWLLRRHRRHRATITSWCVAIKRRTWSLLPRLCRGRLALLRLAWGHRLLMRHGLRLLRSRLLRLVCSLRRGSRLGRCHRGRSGRLGAWGLLRQRLRSLPGLLTLRSLGDHVAPCHLRSPAEPFVERLRPGAGNLRIIVILHYRSD